VQNGTHFHTYCKDFVSHFELMALGDDGQDNASELIAQQEIFDSGEDQHNLAYCKNPFDPNHEFESMPSSQ